MVRPNEKVTGGTRPNQRMAIEERYVYLNIQYDRYRQADRRTKGEMLTEMMAVTGMHRKALIRLMGSRPSRHPRQKQRARVYGAEVEQVVRLIDRVGANHEGLAWPRATVPGAASPARRPPAPTQRRRSVAR